MRRWDFAAIEKAFVDAAVDTSRWNAAMEVAAEATNSYGAGLFPVKGRLPQLPYSPSMAESFETYVTDGWIHRDERYRALPAVLRKGVATEFDFITPEEIARHPYYQEFLAPHGLRWGAFVLFASGDEAWCLTIQRTISQGPFSPEEQKRLATLSPRLSSAAAVARALGFARAEAALEAFTLSGSAVVLFDRNGAVLRANAAAERMLAQDPRIDRGRIVCASRDATAALDRALHALLWHTDAPPLIVPLPRRGRRPVLAYPARLASVSRDALAPCQAVVTLVDPEQQVRPPEAALRSSFGLTEAEAKLAAKLATGETLEAVSDRLGIASATARNQLKSIFAKTGVHRQAELVALLLTLFGQSFGGA